MARGVVAYGDVLEIQGVGVVGVQLRKGRRHGGQAQPLQGGADAPDELTQIDGPALAGTCT